MQPSNETCLGANGTFSSWRGGPGYVVTHEGQTEYAGDQEPDGVPRCCATTKPSSFGGYRTEATTIHVVLSDSSGHWSTVITNQTKVRFHRGLIPFTIDRGDTTVLWSSPDHWPDGDGHRGHTSSFLQTSCRGGVRQSPQMKPGRVSR